MCGGGGEFLSKDQFIPSKKQGGYEKKLPAGWQDAPAEPTVGVDFDLVG